MFWGSAARLTLLAEKLIRLERRLPADVEPRLRKLEATATDPAPSMNLIGAKGLRRLKVSVAVPIAGVEPFVRECIDAVVAAGGYHELIVIDDRGAVEVPPWLERIVSSSGARLMRHHAQLGYTASANQALATAAGDVLVLLNSDTIVSQGWIEKLTAPLLAHPETAMVGPWSNAATFQSMPSLPDGGAYKANDLPAGLTVARINATLDEFDAQYPLIRSLNGFCLAIRLDAAAEIGFFSLQEFPEGYGEEVDYCLRAAALGYHCRVADNLFVLHHKSRSFGHARRAALTDAGRNALIRRYGADEIGRLLVEMREWSLTSHASCRVRSSLRPLWEIVGTSVPTAPARLQPMSVAFVLPTRPEGGGILNVIDDARGLQRLGTSVSLVVNPVFEDQYRTLIAGDDVKVVAANIVDAVPSKARRVLAEYDCIVATYWTSVAPTAAAAVPTQLVVHYVQDFEPDFSATAVLRSGALAALFVDRVDMHIVRTPWLRERLFQATGRRAATIAPAIDEARVPREIRPFALRRYDVAAMVRPETPRRSADLTLAVLREFARIRPDAGLVLFGSGARSASASGWPRGAVAAGNLGNAAVLELLNETRLFVDFSEWQALGRTALEALECGAIPLMTPDSGLLDYLGEDAAALTITRDGDPALIAERLAASFDTIATAPLQQRLLEKAAMLSSEEAALTWSSTLRSTLALHRVEHSRN